MNRRAQIICLEGAVEYWKELRSKIIQELPVSIDCPEGCTSCCTNKPTTLSGYAEKEDGKIVGITFHLIDRPRECPQIPAGRCLTYKSRPMMCALYGIVDHPLMRCKVGLLPTRFLTTAELLSIVEESEELEMMITDTDKRLNKLDEEEE